MKAVKRLFKKKKETKRNLHVQEEPQATHRTRGVSSPATAQTANLSHKPNIATRSQRETVQPDSAVKGTKVSRVVDSTGRHSVSSCNEDQPPRRSSNGVSQTPPESAGSSLETTGAKDTETQASPGGDKYKGVSENFKGLTPAQRFDVKEVEKFHPEGLSRLGDAYDSIPLLEQTKLPRGGISLETKAVGRVQVSIV